MINVVNLMCIKNKVFFEILDVKMFRIRWKIFLVVFKVVLDVENFVLFVKLICFFYY